MGSAHASLNRRAVSKTLARHRRFSVEFKRRVAQEHLADGVTLGALARHHDISRDLIRLWVEKYEAGEFDDDDLQADLLAHCQRRVTELERKVGQLVMENEWLKKSRRAAVQRNVASSCVVVCAANRESRATTSSAP